MEKPNNYWHEMSDAAILETMGQFLKETRLQQNKTQQQLASVAGIHRFTVVQMENGKGGTLKSFIQLMRGLEQLQLFQHFQASHQISPLELAKLEQGRRLRARNKKKPNKESKSDW